MSLQASGSAMFGEVEVLTTTNRGFTPEEIAERALNKIISVGESSHPAIRDQAVAFRDYIRQVLVYYMYEAIKSDRTTQMFKLQESGHPELVKLLEQ